MECLKCGTCCTAPDISTLGKPLGVRCGHLDENGLCTIYEERPAVCRGYRPDGFCLEIAAPTLTERTARYLEMYGLTRDGKESYGAYRFSENSPSANSP